MEHLWAPVGTGVRPQEETDFVVGSLFGDHEGLRVTRGMDAVISELPGFAGARILEAGRTETLRRVLQRGQPPGGAMPFAALRA
jgi:hypothetical protein